MASTALPLPADHAFLLAAAVILSVSFYVLFAASSSPVPLPPGPSPAPFVGNALQLPQEYQERTYLEWGRKFGEVVYVKLFQTPVVIVNSMSVARELMDKRGAIYSDRPQFTLLGEVIGCKDMLPLIPYGDRFRRYRKWYHDGFMTQEILTSYRPIIKRELYAMLKKLSNDPLPWSTYFFKFTAQIVTEITYGYRVTSDDDEYVKLTQETMEAVAASGSAASMLIDIFPFLRHYPMWMPGSGFKKQPLRTRDLMQGMMDTQYNVVKDNVQRGRVNSPSFTAKLLEKHFSNGSWSHQDHLDIRGAAGTLYSASTESMVSVMSTFILAMVLYPDAFKKAQEEIDRVVGLERLPEWEDRAALPYLDCLMKEVYRWNVPVPLGMPHVVTQDDIFQGHRIPAKSMIIGNVWGMSQDEELYPEPERFKPERFMKMSPDDPADPNNIIFGFGRRICPGMDFANSSLFIFMATMIATMDIAPAKDAKGRDIMPSGQYTSGFIRRPKDFVCSIRTRSAKAARLIQDAESD